MVTPVLRRIAPRAVPCGMPTTCRHATRPRPPVRECWRSTHDLAGPMHVGRRATAIPEIDFFALHIDWLPLSAAREADGARALHLKCAVGSDMRLSPGGVNQDGVIEFRQLWCKV